MASVPRIEVDEEKGRTPFGVTDPFPSFSEELNTVRRQLQALAYAASSLDRVSADLFRIGVAELVDCGICKNMRDVSLQAGNVDEAVINQLTSRDHPDVPEHVRVFISFARSFISDPHDIDAAIWAEFRSHFDSAQIAQLLTLYLGMIWDPKMIIVCGFEPESPDAITSTAFDRSGFDAEEGVASMAPAKENATATNGSRRAYHNSGAADSEPVDLEALLRLEPEWFRWMGEMHRLVWELTDARELELCRLRLAQLVGCEPELAVRYEAGRQAGVDEATVAELRNWPTSERFTARDRDFLAFVEQFRFDVQGVTDEQAQAVLNHLDDEQFFVFSLAIGMYESWQSLLVALNARQDKNIALATTAFGVPATIAYQEQE